MSLSPFPEFVCKAITIITPLEVGEEGRMLFVGGLQYNVLWRQITVNIHQFRLGN